MRDKGSKSYRRSALYVPAINQRALVKAPSLGADVLIYDLEDAVLPDQKPEARELLSKHLACGDPATEIVVRINAIDTSAFNDDLAWLKDNPGIDVILLPKVRQPQDIESLRKALDRTGVKAPIWLMIETVDAVLDLKHIARCTDPGTVLLLGAEDLAREMKLAPTPGRLGLLSVLTQLVLCARSSGLDVLDAVYPNINDENGFQQSCEQGRNLGFDGKTLIHPGQVEIANQVFSPQPAEVDKANRIIDAWSIRTPGAGVITVDGLLVEQLHVDQAVALLERAQALSDNNFPET